MSTLTTSKIHFFNDIVDTANTLGAEVFIVGGVVRDIILGKHTADIDIIPFNVEYDKFAKALAKSIKAYSIPFKDNIRLAKNDIIIDVSKPRGANIHEDIMKRDFTINNLALDIDGNIIGDDSDIHNKTINAVYANTFIDDALRILRAFRFASQLGFTINDYTLQLALASAPLLKNIASERILEELKKTITGEHFNKILENPLWINVLSKNVNVSLDSVTISNLKSYEHVLGDDLFSAIIASSLEPKKAIKTLKPSNNDIKLVEFILKAEKDMISSTFETERDIKIFAWNYYDKIETITSYFMSKYPDNIKLFNDMLRLSKTLDVENAKHITGDMLILLGFAPSPLFKTIIADVSQKLALNELQENEIVIYINNKYRD